MPENVNSVDSNQRVESSLEVHHVRKLKDYKAEILKKRGFGAHMGIKDVQSQKKDSGGV